MQRDNEYLRDLLFEIENQNDNIIVIVQSLDNSHDEKKWYHAQLLCDSGYLVQTLESGYRLTGQGHDFIESIRDEGIWNKTKTAISETGGYATLEIIKCLACGFLKERISTHTGFEL